MNDVIGVIMAGGESKRMGVDKALLDYHGKAQYLWLADMLHNEGLKTVISSNKLHAATHDLQIISDRTEFSNHGPMGGLLSVNMSFPDKALLLIGCDYPSFDFRALKKLLSERSPSSGISTFINKEGIPEPLLAIYESDCVEEIKEDFQKTYQDSLRAYMTKSGFHAIEADDPAWLQSIDDPENYRTWKERSKG